MTIYLLHKLLILIKFNKGYSILTYILLVPAAILGILTFFGLLLALANPSLLLLIFLLACVVIYTIACMIFLQKVVLKQNKTQKKLKDWIKVNAIGTGIFAMMMGANFFQYLAKPSAVAESVNIMMTQQKAQLPPMLTADLLITTTTTMLYIFAFYGFGLIAHIAMTFVQLKKHDNFFE